MATREVDTIADNEELLAAIDRVCIACPTLNGNFCDLCVVRFMADRANAVIDAARKENNTCI